MKRWLPAILLICAVVAAAWYFAWRGKTQSPPGPDTPENSNSTVAALHSSKTVATVPERHDSAPSHGKSIAGSSPSTTTPSAPAKPLPYFVGAAEAPPTGIEP